MKTSLAMNNILLFSSLSLSANAFTAPKSNIYSKHMHEIANQRLNFALKATPEVLTDAWASYNTLLETSPLITKSVTACGILGAADLAGQVLEKKISPSEDIEDDSSIDLARFIRFAIFGLVLQAPWNHYYYLLLDGVLPPTEDPFSTTTAAKVVIDQFVQAPIFTVLIFYFLGLLEGKAISNIQDQLKDDYTDTMLANWKLWVPATVVNIAFVPPILRVLYLNSVFFFWSIYLSLKLNSGGKSNTDDS